MLELGACFGSGGMEIVTLNNGAVVKSLHGDLKHAAHSRYYLSGTRGGLLDPNRDCMVCAYTEGPGENCRGKKEEYKAEHPIAEAGRATCSATAVRNPCTSSSAVYSATKRQKRWR